MASPKNFEGRIKARRQGALARREADIQKIGAQLAESQKGEDKTHGTSLLKKLDRAKADVVNLYAKLGMKKNSGNSQ